VRTTQEKGRMNEKLVSAFHANNREKK